MILLHKLRGSIDLSYGSLSHNVTLQIHMAFSLIVASIPAYRPFMKRATSGMLAIRLEPGCGTYGVSGVSEDIPLRSISKDPNQIGRRGNTPAQASTSIWKTVAFAVDSRTGPGGHHSNAAWDTNT
jgi:hypothetical protein